MADPQVPELSFKARTVQLRDLLVSMRCHHDDPRVLADAQRDPPQPSLNLVLLLSLARLPNQQRRLKKNWCV
ncbi:MAG: hypothetical protein ACRDZ4_22140 [Egibacteraceae bacterium]